MRLYEQHHYGKRADAAGGPAALNPAGRASAYLTLGMIYLGNAELHRELYETAVTVQLDYLKKLAAVRGAEGSRFANLYLGKALLESGEARDAAKYLERFSAQQDPRSLPGHRRGQSRLESFRRQQRAGGSRQWASVDTADPEVQMALAAAYSRAGLKDRDPVAVGERREEAGASRRRACWRSAHRLCPRRADRQGSGAGQAGGPEGGLVHRGARSDQGDQLSMTWPPSVIWRRCTVARACSIWRERRPTAAQAGRLLLPRRATPRREVERSQRAFSTFLASPRRRRRRSGIGHGFGMRPASTCRDSGGEAMAVWDGLARSRRRSELLAEILSACARVRAGCAGVESRAARASEAGEDGRRAR